MPSMQIYIVIYVISAFLTFFVLTSIISVIFNICLIIRKYRSSDSEESVSVRNSDQSSSLAEPVYDTATAELTNPDLEMTENVAYGPLP